MDNEQQLIDQANEELHSQKVAIGWQWSKLQISEICLFLKYVLGLKNMHSLTREQRVQ